MIREASGRLAALMTKATDTLEGLLDSDNEDVRHKAAKTVLEQAVKVGELADVVARVDAIEKSLFTDPQGAAE